MARMGSRHFGAGRGLAANSTSTGDSVARTHGCKVIPSGTFSRVVLWVAFTSATDRKGYHPSRIALSRVRFKWK